MKRKWAGLLCIVMILSLLPLNALAGLYWGNVVRITNSNAVNVRKGPGSNYGMVGEAMSTNTYTYLGEVDGWYEIQFTSSQNGWVSSKYTTVEPGLVWDDWAANEVDAVVRNTHYNALNVRAGATKNSRTLGSIKPDTTWPYCGTENGWNRILYNGEYAYVAANRTTIEVVDTHAGATGAASDCDSCKGTLECTFCDGDGIRWGTRECLLCNGTGRCTVCD